MSQALLPSSPAPSVSLHDGRSVITSHEVAHYSRKRYDNVVHDIRNIMDSCPEEFTAFDFEVSNYLDQTGRSPPMHIIFRDDFTFLAMGYAGLEAIRFKFIYIEAFNRMEAEFVRCNRPVLSAAPRFDEAAMLELVAETRKVQQHYYRASGRLCSRPISISIPVFIALESRVYRQVPDRPFSNVRTGA